MKFISTYKAGNQCHKSLQGVMANFGFGNMFVIGRDGVKYQIPSICLKKTDGNLKKNWRGLFIKEMGFAIPA